MATIDSQMTPAVSKAHRDSIMRRWLGINASKGLSRVFSLCCEQSSVEPLKMTSSAMVQCTRVAMGDAIGEPTCMGKVLLGIGDET